MAQYRRKQSQRNNVANSISAAAVIATIDSRSLSFARRSRCATRLLLSLITRRARAADQSAGIAGVTYHHRIVTAWV